MQNNNDVFDPKENLNKTEFDLANLTFTVIGEKWLHVTDQDRRQENAFGYEGLSGFVKAVKDRFFEESIPPHDIWFCDQSATGKNAFFVEYCKWYSHREIVIHSEGGYRLHLSLSEFRILISHLQKIWNL